MENNRWIKIEQHRTTTTLLIKYNRKSKRPKLRENPVLKVLSAVIARVIMSVLRIPYKLTRLIQTDENNIC